MKSFRLFFISIAMVGAAHAEVVQCRYGTSTLEKNPNQPFISFYVREDGMVGDDSVGEWKFYDVLYFENYDDRKIALDRCNRFSSDWVMLFYEDNSSSLYTPPAQPYAMNKKTFEKTEIGQRFANTWNEQVKYIGKQVVKKVRTISLN